MRKQNLQGPISWRIMFPTVRKREKRPLIKLMIDAMGGDNAPQAIVEGCVAALKDMKDLHLTLFGRKEEIEAILKDMEYEKDRLDIVDAREIVDNNEAPVMAVRRKKTAVWSRHCAPWRTAKAMDLSAQAAQALCLRALR